MQGLLKYLKNIFKEDYHYKDRSDPNKGDSIFEDRLVMIAKKIHDLYKYNIEPIINDCIMFLPGSGYVSEVRYQYLKHKFKNCAGRVNIGFGVWIPEPQTVSIGKNVSINRFVVIDSSSGCIEIGNDCLIGPFCVLRAADHIYQNKSVPIYLQGHKGGTITIDDDCWLGSHVTVTRDVHIGNGSIIGANSVVTNDIPPYSVAVGAPARVIKKRS